MRAETTHSVRIEHARSLITVLWLVFGNAEHDCLRRKRNGRTWLGGVNGIWFTVSGEHSTADTVAAYVSAPSLPGSLMPREVLQLRIPAAMLDGRDIRAILDVIATQSEGAVRFAESSIDLIEQEAMVH